MNETVRKVFDILGVEPNEEFNIRGFKGKFHYDYDLWLKNEENLTFPKLVVFMLKDPSMIIKIPKEPRKKKLRDLTEEDYKKWEKKNCKIYSACAKCVFKNVVCNGFYSEHWINHKDMYSDKFLDQEIEVEE